MTGSLRHSRSRTVALPFTLRATCTLLVVLSLVFTGCNGGAGSSKNAAPDFQVQTFAYENVSLGTFSGKPLVLAFMASW